MTRTKGAYPVDFSGISNESEFVGTVFGNRYRILAALGHGGMGVVYKAEDTRLQRIVALKFLSPSMTSDKGAKLRFIQEAQAASGLDHQNICTIHEIEELENGLMFIAMACYDGETLKSLIERGPVAFSQALDVMMQTARGLEKAHGRGIVHRDIKPANIIVTAEGIAKILDFGLAKPSGQARLTGPAVFLGTVAYMSPEQGRGEDVDVRTDIWSWGVVFYELLTGVHPFPGKNESAVLYAIQTTFPLSPREIRAEIPNDVERIVLRCLRKQREERYSDMQAILADFRGLKQSAAPGIREDVGEGRPIVGRWKEIERRQATVLCADIVGFEPWLESLDPEDAALMTNRIFGTMESIVRKYDGRIDKIAGGHLMVLFGVPSAIEDGPKKSINAAIELLRGVNRFNLEENLRRPLDLRIGIETGTVIAGMRDAADYTAMGDAVQGAVHWRDLAEKGQVRVGPQTHRCTPDDFEFEEIKAGGFLLLSYQEKPQRTRDGTERMLSSRMVGRERELARLKGLLLNVINGEGAIVNIIGEAGIGKSRLMAELGRADEINKVTFLMGRALSNGRNLSFHPLIDLLKSWAGIKDHETPGGAIRKLESCVADVDSEGVADIVPFIATMMGWKTAGRYAERLRGIQGEALENLILKNLRSLITKISEIRPIVFVVEDLHWADCTSIETLESLFRLAESHRILFVNIFRPNYPDTGERIRETIQNRYGGLSTDIFLDRLNEDECDVLIENLLNIGGLPAHVRELISRRAEGNPLFIEEVARSLVDDGAVVIEDGRFRVTEKIDDVVIPESITEILMARIDKLEDGAKALIKIASVIGREFFYRVLAEIAGAGGDLEKNLEILQKAQLIKERRRLEEVEYLFKHPLIQEVVYESLLLKKRKEIHLRVADAIESLFVDRRHEFFGKLAFHYTVGENLDKAEEYLIKAGEEALKTAASSEAIHYNQEALKIYGARSGAARNPERLAELEWNLARAFMNRGRMIEAVTHFDRVLAVWGEKRPKAKAVASLDFAFNAVKVLSSLYLQVRTPKRIPSKRLNNIFEATYQRGTALVSVDTWRMVTDSIRILGISRKYDLQNVVNGVAMHASASALFFYSGLSFPIARRLLASARRIISPHDRKSLFTYEFYKLAMDTLSGEWKADLPYDATSADQSIQDGDLFTPTAYILFLCIRGIERGAFSDVRKAIEKLGDIGDLYENDYVRTIRHILQMRYRVKCRMPREALAESENAIALMRRAGQKFWSLHCLGLIANAYILKGDLLGAGLILERAERVERGEDRISPIYIGPVRLSRFLLDVRAYEEALSGPGQFPLKTLRKNVRESGRRAIRNSRKCAFNRPEVFRLAGVYHWLAGDPTKALAWWSKSVDAGMRLGARIELARTYSEAGRRLTERAHRVRKSKGLMGEDFLRKAATLFRELPQSGDLEELGSLDHPPPGEG
jgi:class 3 adenylate cyclase/tetratricopeptide (TPR) repeat protein